MMHRNRIRFAVSAFALFFGSHTNVNAQASTPKEPRSSVEEKKPLVFGSEVALVQVPVFVSGKDGGAAQGLKAEDFIVEQDGKAVDVVSFRYVDTTSDEQQEQIREASAARRRFLLLFDKSFTDPSGLARARKYAKEFVLHHLAESDLVGVATFDFLRGIRLVANFTEDRRVVEHAIHTLGIPSLTKITDPLAIAADFTSTDLTPERDNVGGTQDTPTPLLQDVMSVLAARARSAEEQSYRTRVMALLDSFDQLGKSLRRIDGRKQIVYFSTGFSSTLLAGQDKVDQTRTSEAIVAGRIWEVDSDARYGDTRMRSIVQDSLQSLARADAVVHSIDLAGMGQKEAFNQTFTEGMATRDSNGRESLGMIAAETGGRFFKDANNLLPVLREMADMTSRYYVLGVSPRDGKPDGSFRKLKVKLRPRGLRVSHRPGFFERAPQVADARVPVLQRQFEAAEMIVSGDAAVAVGATTLDFKALVIPVPSDDEKQRLGIVVQVPKASLPANEGSIEVYGYALDTHGQVVDHFAHFLRVDASRVGEAVDGLSFAGQFALPAGAYTLRLMAQRPDSGQLGLRFYEVNVPKREASAGFLLPPMFVEDRTRWVEVAMKRPGSTTDDQTGLPFDLDLSGTRFLPRPEISVRPGQRERMVLISYEPERAKDPATDVDIRSVLSDSLGKNYAPGLIAVEKVHHTQDGRRSYVLTFTPEASLAPGDYTLRMHVGEGRSVLESYCRLKVLPRSE